MNELQLPLAALLVASMKGLACRALESLARSYESPSGSEAGSIYQDGRPLGTEVEIRIFKLVCILGLNIRH